MRSKDADGMAKSLDAEKIRIITVVHVCHSILSPDTYFNFLGGNTLLCDKQTMVPQCRQRE